MKAVLIVLLILAVVYKGRCENFIEKLMEFAPECAKKSGASSEDIAGIRAKITPTTREGKCMVACMQEGIGYQTSEGKLDTPSIIASLDTLKASDPDLYKRVKEIYDACTSLDLNGIDRCDAAASLMGCMREHFTKAGLEEEMVVM